MCIIKWGILESTYKWTLNNSILLIHRDKSHIEVPHFHCIHNGRRWWNVKWKYQLLWFTWPNNFILFISYSPDPTIPTNIWVTFSVSSKAWALTTSTLTFSTMAASKSVLATLWTSGSEEIISCQQPWTHTNQKSKLINPLIAHLVRRETSTSVVTWQQGRRTI